MTTDVFLEAFGQLVGMLPEEDRLYPAFDSRAEMMGWTHTQSPSPPYAWLWDMHDAEITAERDTHRLGWVQVGLHGESKMPGSQNWPTVIPADHPSSFFFPLGHQRRYPTQPAVALPALGQCFEDALRRCVGFMWTGLQVSFSFLESHIRPFSVLPGAHQWFEQTAPKTRTPAYIAFDQAWLEPYDTAMLAVRLHQALTFPFSFGPVVTVPEPHRIAVRFKSPDILQPATLGLAVTLPEWTMNAAASALALVLNTAHTMVPDIQHCALRLTKGKVSVSA